jgi:hypothetical protein
MMELTEENYYTKEADLEYFSVSQFKSFMQCEAAAMEKLRGEYEPPMTKAMLVGSFVDAYVEGTLDSFIKKHPEVFTRRKELRAEFRQANEIIKLIDEHKDFNKFLSGEHQKILTAEMFGVPWKIKMDSFIEGICITDLKVIAKTKNLPYWRYDWQGAVYQKVAEANGCGLLPFYLATVTKEKVSDINIFQIEQAQLDLALREVEENMPHLIEVKQGKAEPKRCESCPYCRMTRKVKVRGYSELMK